MQNHPPSVLSIPTNNNTQFILLHTMHLLTIMAKTTTTPKLTFISHLALVASIFLCECDPLLANTSINGFTTDLIHRDSPDSPLYDPSSMLSDRLATAAERSRLRAKHFNDSFHKKAAESIITSANGPYLMRFSIGSPPEQVIAVVDTGSHLTWTQCRPCNKCIAQRQPLFNPELSDTYRDIRCDSYSCDAYSPSTFCDRRREKCLYNVHYEDGSYSHGVVATELFSFTSSTATAQALFFNKIVFGCGHNNSFVHLKGTASGIVGLAGGSSSLVRQLGYDKFSYCLMPPEIHSKASKLHFGGDAVVSGRGVATTPLSARAAYYFLTLEAISVGNQRLEYHNPYLVAGGNIVIDSGSLLTMLPVNFYDRLEVAIANSIAARAVRDFGDWRLCYSSRFVMPKITVHFKGADVEWRFYNAFVRASEDFVCLAVDPIEGLPIYGNVAQANYLVGYDLGRRMVSFKQEQCGKY